MLDFINLHEYVLAKSFCCWQQQNLIETSHERVSTIGFVREFWQMRIGLLKINKR